MIHTKEISYVDKEKERTKLKNLGYISATTIFSNSKNHNFFIEKYNDLYVALQYYFNSKQLKTIFNNESNLSAICLNISGKKSYWYYIADLKIVIKIIELNNAIMKKRNEIVLLPSL